MTAPATELPTLLRACLKWDVDRPRVDNDALLVVADWCEDKGRAGDAAAVRDAMAWPLAARYEPGCKALPEHYTLRRGPGGERSGFIAVCYFGPPHSSATANAVWGDCGPLETLGTERDEVAPGRLAGAWPTRGGVQRIAHLARWMLISQMLGYPRWRLLCEG